MSWAVIAAFLFATVLPLVVSVLIGLGIGFVTYTGATFGIDQAETTLNNLYGSMSASLFGMLDIIGLIAGTKIILAAYAAQIAIRSTLGAFTKMKFTPTA